MARARNLKPSLFKNEVLGTADPLLTILFESLWCLADRAGRLEDRPLRIKAETFPYREGLDVNVYLTELERLGFICRYEVAGMRCIQVLEFVKHQNPHKTERPSELPEMPVKSDSCATTVIAPLNNGSRPADSLLPLTDSLLPPTDSPAQPTKPKSEARASRLPQDWRPNDADVEFCKTERPDLRPSVVASRFYDYWIAQPGAKGRKADWSATWRNWVRNEKPGNMRQPGSPADVDAARQAANAEAKRRLGIDDGRTIDAQ